MCPGMREGQVLVAQLVGRTCVDTLGVGSILFRRTVLHVRRKVCQTFMPPGGGAPRQRTTITYSRFSSEPFASLNAYTRKLCRPYGMYSLLTRAPLLYARALVTVSYFNCEPMASFVFVDTVRHVANDALQIVYAKLCRTSRGLTPPSQSATPHRLRRGSNTLRILPERRS